MVCNVADPSMAVEEREQTESRLAAPTGEAAASVTAEI
jgi:hypothetical protein